MHELPLPPCGNRRPGALRQLVGASLLGFLIAAGLLLAPALASADTPSTLTVVGTSDVADSGLAANVIAPAFKAAYPQFAFRYIGTATGKAITSAETGADGASVLIVHSAPLEVSFVQQGYSYEGPGRAIFSNDFVLAGSSGDPAGVAANASNDIVTAFIDVATAGINGGGTPKATFVSRGGAPGTTVQEHQIWALVAAQPSPPAGLLLCAVNPGLGGGDTPIAAGNGVTANGQACPNNGALPSGAALPPWYVTTGLTQGPNVQKADACTGYPSGPNSCYVFTDRGTYDYLLSGKDPAGTITNLKIVTRNNSASAPGGPLLLDNYFHAYIVDPTAVPSANVNLTAAQDFLNLLTSPALQAQVASYLANTTDPGGPPFLPTASPGLTANGFPTGSIAAGTPVTVTGTLTNLERAYPPLSGQTVNIDKIAGGVPTVVASGTTDANGNYSITFRPQSSGSYQVATDQLTALELQTINGPYYDVLSPASTTPVQLTLTGSQTSCTVIAVRRGPNTPSGRDEQDVRVNDPSGLRSVSNVLITNGQVRYFGRRIDPGGTTFPGGTYTIVLTAVKTTQGQRTAWSFDVTNTQGTVTHCM